MNKPKLNQLDVEKLTSQELQNLIDEYCLTPQNIREILVVGQMFRKSTTIEDVKKEWEDDGYTWEEDEIFITIYREDPLDDNVVKEILINKSRKTYECYDASDYEETSLSLTLEEHIRLTKTFIAKGWKV